MNYDIIPEYDAIFKDDCFKLHNPHLDSIAYALSFWGYLYTEKDACNKTLLADNIGLIGIDKNGLDEILRNKIAITELGVLRAWKIIFEELNKDNVIRNHLLYSFNYLYRLIIKEQKECVTIFEEKSPYNSLMMFTILNYLDNVNNEFFRTYFMFVKNKELFSSKFLNFNDIYAKFKNKYGLTLYEYMEALYVLVMCKCEANFNGIKQEKDLSKYSFVISLDQINDIKTKQKVKKALEILSFDYKE